MPSPPADRELPLAPTPPDVFVAARFSRDHDRLVERLADHIETRLRIGVNANTLRLAIDDARIGLADLGPWLTPDRST